ATKTQEIPPAAMKTQTMSKAQKTADSATRRRRRMVAGFIILLVSLPMVLLAVGAAIRFFWPSGGGGTGAPNNGGGDSPIVKVVADKDGFVPLFNGKDLDGWKTHDEQPGDWNAADGAL